jgi:hypothetical protein
MRLTDFTLSTGMIPGITGGDAERAEVAEELEPHVGVEEELGQPEVGWRAFGLAAAVIGRWSAWVTLDHGADREVADPRDNDPEPVGTQLAGRRSSPSGSPPG